jgi:hypothetical protein
MNDQSVHLDSTAHFGLFAKPTSDTLPTADSNSKGVILPVTFNARKITVQISDSPPGTVLLFCLMAFFWFIYLLIYL